MKKLFSLAMLVILVLLSLQLYRLYKQRLEISRKLMDTENKLEEITKENGNLQADIEYFAKPENLAKELKSKYDYKRPGEKVTIIVPKR